MNKAQKNILSLFFAILLVTAPFHSVLAQASVKEHTVQQGETLSSISREYDVSVDDLLRWNQLSSNQVSAGQVIKLQLPEPDESENRQTHTVEPGETLYSISRTYKVSIAEIQQWNSIDGTNLETGQQLVLYPGNTQTEQLPPSTQRESIVQVSENDPGNAYYTVRSGDTLSKIAREHDMSLSELRQLNDLSNERLNVGQRITVRQKHSTPSVADNSETSTPQGKFVNYQVKDGEDGEVILSKFEMNETELKALNPGLSIDNITEGQRLTILLPPNRTFPNPYSKGSNLEDLGSVPVFSYSESDIAGSTTSGELYNPIQLTAAHPNMALGNIVYVENPATAQGIYVRINDRHSNQGLKVSHKAFEMLGFSSRETGQVRIYLDQ